MSEIDLLKRKDNFDILLKSVEYANYLCDIDNPIVVIHPSDIFVLENDLYSEFRLYENKKIFEEELYKISNLVESRYPNVRLGLENTTPFVKNIKTNEIVIHNGFVYPDYMIDINNMNLVNVGHVLDICHALSTIRFNNLVTLNKSNIDIKTYVDTCIDKLFLIHLNNLDGLGEIPSKHSTPFLENNYNDLEILRELFNLLNAYKYGGYITIEVLEDDYYNGINYELSMRAVNKIIKEY